MSDIQACGSEIKLDTIRRRLLEKNNSRLQISENHYRAAAVLIPLVCYENKWHLLYTRRTDLVQSHKGQVSFPGGAVENSDISREDTALRETYEEIGVQAEDVQILGRLWDMHTITGFVITPVVAHMNWPINLNLSLDEVSRAFIVPLEWLANRAHHTEIEMDLPDGSHQTVIHYDPYEGENIWGATARLTLNLLHTIL